LCRRYGRVLEPSRPGGGCIRKRSTLAIQITTPRGSAQWLERTNRFCATSSAAPQVGALAALLYAQRPQRDYRDVIGRIEQSTAGRETSAAWGKARGLVDYAQALGW
jgi:hypothetical protein